MQLSLSLPLCLPVGLSVSVFVYNVTVDESFNNYHFAAGRLNNGDRYLDLTETSDGMREMGCLWNSQFQMVKVDKLKRYSKALRRNSDKGD